MLLTPIDLIKEAKGMIGAQVGVLMLDIEGAEMRVLNAWPWDVAAPWAVLVEHNYRILRYLRIRRLMRVLGYEEWKNPLLKQDALFIRH